MRFNTDEFTSYLREHAEKHSQARCAKYVRRALEAGGANTSGHPGDAKAYGRVLIRNGFYAVTVQNPETFMPMKGDVVVMQPTKGGNQAGHVEGYDGRNWISDFVQNGFWPGPVYAKEKPSYVVYRK